MAGIKSFDPNLITTLESDWSVNGMGFWLRQKHCTCKNLTLECCRDGWKTSLVGSKFCSGAESRYAAIEGELAAIVWALQKTKIFTLGASKLVVVTDHKPLVNILKNIKSENETIRISRLKHTIIDWKFMDVWYVKGVKNAGPDALSRAFSISELNNVNVQKITYEKVIESYKSSLTMQTLIQYVKFGFPSSKANMSPELQRFWNYRLNIKFRDDLLFYSDRLIVPNSLKKEILEKLHGAHQGTRGMELRASRCFFWPGMTNDIKKIRENCLSCNESMPSNPNLPQVAIEEPEFPRYLYRLLLFCRR